VEKTSYKHNVGAIQVCLDSDNLPSSSYNQIRSFFDGKYYIRISPANGIYTAFIYSQETDELILCTTSFISARSAAIIAWYKIYKFHCCQGTGVDMPHFKLPSKTEGGAAPTEIPTKDFRELCDRTQTRPPPLVDPRYQRMCEKVWGKDYQKYKGKTFISTLNSHLNALDAYLNGGETYDNTTTPVEWTPDDVYDFLCSDISNKEFETTIARLSSSVKYVHNAQGIREKIDPDVSDEAARDWYPPPGVPGDAGHPINAGIGGAPQGKKIDNSAHIREWFISAHKIFDNYFDNVFGDRTPTLEEANEHIGKLIKMEIFNLFPFVVVKGFIKVEHMQAKFLNNKPPREIWLAALLAVFIDSLLFDSSHKRSFTNFYSGDAHGINQTSGGMGVFTSKMIDSSLADDLVKRAEELLEDSDIDFKDLPPEFKLCAKESDVSRYDFSQFFSRFLSFYSMHLYLFFDNIDAVTKKEFWTFYLFLLSSYYMMIQIIPATGEKFNHNYFAYVWRILASGTKNTAYAGSYLHSDVRGTYDLVLDAIMNASFRMIDSNPKYLPYKDKLQLSRDCVEKMRYVHFSDDFVSCVGYPGAFFLSLVPESKIYQMFHLPLKVPKNADAEDMKYLHQITAMIESNYPNLDDFASDLVEFCPSLRNWGINDGTLEGLQIIDGMTSPSVLYSPLGRLRNELYTYMSFVDSSTGDVVVRGCVFLKNLTVVNDDGDIIPFRKQEDILSRLFTPCGKLSTDLYDLLLYNMVMSFFSVGNQPLYLKHLELNNLMLAELKVNDIGDFLQRKIHDKHNNPFFEMSMGKHFSNLPISAEGIQAFPSYKQIVDHWVAPRGPVAENGISVRENNRYGKKKKLFKVQTMYDANRQLEGLLSSLSLDEVGDFGQMALDFFKKQFDKLEK
jgi:hypothetical protein